jgi:hypothetical protein
MVRPAIAQFVATFALKSGPRWGEGRFHPIRSNKAPERKDCEIKISIWEEFACGCS